MKFFVVEGKSLAFTLTSSAATDTKVSFKVNGATIGALTVAAASFAAAGQDPKTNKAIFTARYSWSAPILGAAISELAVTMEHDKQAKGAKPTDILVYRDKLTIQTVASGTASPPANVAGVRCALKIKADDEWLSYTKRAQPPGATVKDTGVDGTAVFEGLPYGVVSVATLAPATLDGVWTKTPAKWTGAVVAGYRVEMVWPPALADGAPMHRQWVNLDAASAIALNDPRVGTGETYGSKATIKIKLAGGIQAAGRPIWVCAVFGSNNSPRIGNPRPALGAQEAKRNEPVVARAMTDANGVASFVLELGVAGGDEVGLYAAGHATVGPENFDVKTRIQTWRRVQINMVKMRTDDAAKEASLRASDPPSVIDADVRAFCSAEFAKAFIEMIWFDDPAEITVSADDLEFVTGARAAILKLDPNRSHTLWLDKSSAGAPGKKLRLALNRARFSPPRLFFFVVDKLFGRGTLKRNLVPASLDALRAGMRISDAGSYFLPEDVDVNRKVILNWSAGQPSYWQIDNGEKRPLTDAALSIVEGTSNQAALIKVPADQIPASGAVKIFVNVQTYSGVVGDAAGQRLTISTSTKVAEPEAKRRARLSYTILHEVGHAFGLVPYKPVDKKWSPQETNPNYYQRTVRDGFHCSSGIDDAEREKDEAEQPWNKASSTLSGKCALYSPLNATTPFEQVSKYCVDCLGYLKAVNLGLIVDPGKASDFPETNDDTRY